jgi:hypothetical protein
MQVLLHGFVKKSAKTLSTDLQVARDRRSKLRVAVINEPFLGGEFDELGTPEKARSAAAQLVSAIKTR